MSRLAAYAVGAGAIIRRDVSVFLTYRAQWISLLLSTVFSLTLFYYVSRLVRVAAFPEPADYYAYVVVGLAVLQVLESSFELPGSVRSELLAGTLERLVVSPFGLVAGICSMMLFPLLLAYVLAATTLGLGALLYDLPIRWSTAALAIPVGFVGSLAFAAFGFLFAATTLVFKQGASARGVVTIGISLLAGFYFPVDLLPDWIEWASYVQPFTPALELSRNVLVGTPLREDAWIEITKLVGFVIILLPVSMLALVAAVNRARRTGTITEY